MKYIVLIFSILIALAGCSGSTQTTSTPNGANPAASNTTNANTLAATNSSPGGLQPYNGAQNLSPNAFNATNDNLKVINYQPKKDEMPIGTRTAPDDSVLSAGSRGREFVETRTFRSHPVLRKVEKIMDGKTVKYKVFLKNGKVVDAPADKMNNMPALAPENILDAIGMLPRPETAAPTARDEKIEKKQQ